MEVQIMNIEILEITVLPCRSPAWSYNWKLLLDVMFSYQYNNYIEGLFF